MGGSEPLREVLSELIGETRTERVVDGPPFPVRFVTTADPWLTTLVDPPPGGAVVRLDPRAGPLSDGVRITMVLVSDDGDAVYVATARDRLRLTRRGTDGEWVARSSRPTAP